jgi:outer membrane protein assembly factor BamD
MDRETKKYNGTMLPVYQSAVTGVLVTLLIGCSLKEAKTDYGLLNEGQKSFANGRFDRAEELFKKLLDSHPDSKLRTYAMMGLADSLYKANKFQEASFQYREFYELYPVHKDTVRARFYKGMSEFSEIKSPDRDQSPAKNAIEDFKKIVSNRDYLDSPFYEESRRKIEECRKMLAENVFLIGKFYFRTASYQSVINRINDLLEEYPAEPYEDEAMYYLAESYYREEGFKNALIEFQKLIEKYPHSLYVSIARGRIADMERVR